MVGYLKLVLTKHNTVICFAQDPHPELVAFVLGVFIRFDNVNLI